MSVSNPGLVRVAVMLLAIGPGEAVQPAGEHVGVAAVRAPDPGEVDVRHLRHCLPVDLGPADHEHLVRLELTRGGQRRLDARAPFVRQKLKMFVAREHYEELQVLSELIEAGKITPVIDRTYPLSQAADAIRYLEKGHARGKIVITV